MGKPQSNTAEFIVKATKFHDGKFDYSKAEYITQHSILTIICPIHGEFQQTAKKHLKYGCNKCAQLIRNASRLLTKDEVLSKAIAVHGDRYSYDNVIYVRSHDKVEITCRIHGIFLQSLHMHISGQGCPQCINKISQAEKEWLNTFNIGIENRYVKIITGPNGKYYYADAYISETNTVYEFHGDYWHGNPKIYDSNKINKSIGITFGELYQRTLAKEQNIKNAGFNLIVMWENDWKSQKNGPKMA